MRLMGVSLTMSAWLFCSCLEDSGAEDGRRIAYTTHYDIEGREVDASYACGTSLALLGDQAALDGFISRWTLRDQGFRMEGFDFQARSVVGIVTGRFSHTPVRAEVLGFTETDDSARLDLRVGCPGCMLDAPSGDVLILSYPRSEKPLAAFVNGKAVGLDSAIAPFEEKSECMEAE